jgi:addiction module HigA family antidote
MEKLNNVIPRKIVLREFLIALAITQIRLATELRISANRAAEILKGHRRITADTALRLSLYFGNSAKF